MIQITFTDTEILATEDGKLVGKIEFALVGNELSILHTYAYESGRGIGSLLMKNAMEWAILTTALPGSRRRTRIAIRKILPPPGELKAAAPSPHAKSAATPASAVP